MRRESAHALVRIPASEENVLHALPVRSCVRREGDEWGLDVRTERIHRARERDDRGTERDHVFGESEAKTTS